MYLTIVHDSCPTAVIKFNHEWDDFVISRDFPIATRVYIGYHELISRSQLREKGNTFSVSIYMQSPDETQLCWPSQSLWSLIAEHVPGSELPKIRAALGNSLVDMYIDLYAEAEMWESLSAQRGPGRGGGAAPRPPQLADPPAIKELVRAEVKMLLQTLRERSSAGRSSEDMVFHYEPAVVDYVLGGSGGSSSKNAVHETRSWSRCSVRSTAADEIEAVRDKLNIANIGQVVDRLKSVLAEECRALNKLLKHLKDDIKQRCKSQSGKQEPTLQDLKDLRGAVQKDLRLFSCSQAASRPTWSAVNQKVSQPRFRLPTLQTSSAETLPALNAVIKPRPAPPLCPAGPRPPAIPPGSRVRRRNISSAAHRALSDIRVAPPMRFCQTVPMHPTVMVPAVLRGWGVQDTHQGRYYQEV